MTANAGWVNVGTDHDTAAFAVESIRRWWKAAGSSEYPAARRLLITADAGGSNGYRTRAWKGLYPSLSACPHWLPWFDGPPAGRTESWCSAARARDPGAAGAAFRASGAGRGLGGPGRLELAELLQAAVVGWPGEVGAVESGFASGGSAIAGVAIANGADCWGSG